MGVHPVLGLHINSCPKDLSLKCNLCSGRLYPGELATCAMQSKDGGLLVQVLACQGLVRASILKRSVADRIYAMLKYLARNEWLVCIDWIGCCACAWQPTLLFLHHARNSF